jgi:hypothetical protein
MSVNGLTLVPEDLHDDERGPVALRVPYEEFAVNFLPVVADNHADFSRFLVAPVQNFELF